MVDIEKVIKGLECCIHPHGNCSKCPYDDGSFNFAICTSKLCKDALALLKEQEAVKPVRDKKTGRFWLCGNCGQYVGYVDDDPLDPNEFDNYCRECGRSVKWE